VIQTESGLGSNPAPAREGQPVTVVYDPANPRLARLDTMLGSGMIHGPLFIAFGTIVTLIAAAGPAVVAAAAAAHPGRPAPATLSGLPEVPHLGRQPHLLR
jgi:Protein of unknown function (DUF3592)